MKPVGSGIIRLPKADMYFRKSTLETLVYQGQRTILTGSGTVNMEGNYTFSIDYKDGFRDWVRIIIWNEEGQIFYDSQYGDEIGVYPTSLVGDFDDWYTSEGLPGTSIDEALEGLLADPGGPVVYPNPSGANGFTYQFFSEENTSISIQIFDLRGIEVFPYSGEAIKGMNHITLIPQLSNGNYLMRISGNDTVQQERVMIKR
ncbi:MAG: T9SS type A sorting domain-containing protein, partial [Cyclobacteriaceae bacterium]